MFAFSSRFCSNGMEQNKNVNFFVRYCMYSGMAKGTSQAEAMLNRKKIKHVALAIVDMLV